MCTAAKTNVDVNTKKAETIATPTLADASVSKAKTDHRARVAANANRDIGTSTRGDLTQAETKKKKLLGE